MSNGADLPVCLLTGAGGRLGQAFMRANAGRMAFVGVYHTRMPDVASQLEASLDPLAAAGPPSAPPPVYLVRADLQEPAEIARVVELTLARHDRIDYVINSAADVAFHGPMLEATHYAERLGKQLLLNSLAPALIASEVARMFWRDRPAENRRIGRSVLNLASISGLKVFAGTGQAGYSASKAALLFMSCHMATEFEYIGVRVNALAPARFPDTISTESVADTVARILGGTANGKIFTIDPEGVRTVN